MQRQTVQNQNYASQIEWRLRYQPNRVRKLQKQSDHQRRMNRLGHIHVILVVLELQSKLTQGVI
jgi:hypothetical protein